MTARSPVRPRSPRPTATRGRMRLVAAGALAVTTLLPTLDVGAAGDDGPVHDVHETITVRPHESEPPPATTGRTGRANTPNGSAFRAVAPERLADTRADDCGCTVLTPDTFRVEVAGAGVPGEAVAAALTVTATNTADAGYATVWPSGTPREETSTVNWGAGQTRANGTIVQLGANGAVDVFVSGSADVLIDVTGVFVPVEPNADAADGRFRPVPPDRILDTRGEAAPGPGSIVRVRPPVPADAVAVAVNVTATGSTTGGYVTAYAAGGPLPPTSTVNTDGPGQTRAAAAIVPISADGLDLFTSDQVHLIVDVTGWFSGPGDDDDGGLFVPVAPLRLFDTRTSLFPVGPGSVVESYGERPDADDALATVTSAASAVVLTTTVTGTSADGFLTAYPARTPEPATSTINWLAGETVANLAISPVSTVGVAFSPSATTDVLVDLTGYFTGTPTTPTEPAPQPPTPAAPEPPASTAPQDPDVAAIVQAAVPADVFAVLGDVEMRFIPGSSSCFGFVGRVQTQLISFGGPFMITEQVLELSGGFVTACADTMIPRSTAAHEVGHVLIGRWVWQEDSYPAQLERRHIVDSLSPGGEECLAESVGQLLFEMRGLPGYELGYGGQFQSCAIAPSTWSLAQQIVAFTT